MAEDDRPAQPAHGTRLFLVRLWCETTTGLGEELCGKVQSVVTGEAHLFRGGDALVEKLSRLLHNDTNPQHDQPR